MKRNADVGLFTNPSILSAFDLNVADNRYRDGMGRLWDFRDADLSSLKSETVVEMAQYSLNFPSGINDVKVAFLVSRDFSTGCRACLSCHQTVKHQSMFLGRWTKPKSG